VIGLSLVSQPANSDETLQRAFELFDQQKEGFITFAQGKHILEGAFNMPEKDVLELFQKIDKQNTGKIYYEEFSAFVRAKPEYAKLFLTYEQLKGGDSEDSTDADLDRFSDNLSEIEEVQEDRDGGGKADDKAGNTPPQDRKIK